MLDRSFRTSEGLCVEVHTVSLPLASQSAMTPWGSRWAWEAGGET